MNRDVIPSRAYVMYGWLWCVGTEGGGPGDSAEAREKKTFAGFLDNVEGDENRYNE